MIGRSIVSRFDLSLKTGFGSSGFAGTGGGNVDERQLIAQLVSVAGR